MSLRIDKYIVRVYLLNFLFVFAASSLVILVFDTIDLVRVFSGSNVGYLTLLKIGYFKNYCTLEKVAPFMFLLAAVKSYTQLANESVVLSAYNMGMSDVRILAPSILVICCFIVLHLSLFMPISSNLFARYKMIEYSKLRDGSDTNNMNIIYPAKNGVWVKQKCINESDEVQSVIIRVSNIERQNKSLMGVDMFFLSENGVFDKKMSAKSLQEGDDVWIARDVTIIGNVGGMVTEGVMNLKLMTSFNDIVNGLIPPEMINIWELPNFIRSARAIGFNLHTYEVYMWRKFLNPIMFIVATVVGYIFINPVPRYNSSNSGYTRSILIVFTMYMLNNFFSVLVYSDLVPVLVVPYALSSCAALYLFWRRYMSLS